LQNSFKRALISLLLLSSEGRKGFGDFSCWYRFDFERTLNVIFLRREEQQTLLLERILFLFFNSFLNDHKRRKFSGQPFFFIKIFFVKFFPNIQEDKK